MSLINKLFKTLHMRIFYYKYIKKYAQQNMLCTERSIKEEHDEQIRGESCFVYRKSTSIEKADFCLDVNSIDNLMEFAHRHSMLRLADKNLLHELHRLHALFADDIVYMEVPPNMYVMF